MREFHQSFGAVFANTAGAEIVDHYGDAGAELVAFRDALGVIDLSARGRLCLLGADRARFLHGQVTNNVRDLAVGRGCYAALVTAKGKIQSDLNIYALADELLLDFEPVLTQTISARLEHYVIADDVQMVDVSSHYGLWSVQGPCSAHALPKLGFEPLPAAPFQFTQWKHPVMGDIYCINQPRLLSQGYDLFVPAPAMAAIGDQLLSLARQFGGRLCGWQALETRRIECGIPRFGVDMDESNLAPETGIEERAISYNKGCYIGQEVISRLKTYGQVAKSLRGLRLDPALTQLPVRGAKLFSGEKDVGYITSALLSPTLGRPIALGYVRREHNHLGAQLMWRSAAGDSPAEIVPLPFS
jgi:folate-binding protein YgfZ